ncbi:MAG: hypothetical protein IBJ10_06235 [Phycisphaerales bacterium]|nr:hypothetical protein [Phycisphaerales bacterium]
MIPTLPSSEPMLAPRRSSQGGATLLIVLLVVTGFTGFGGVTALLEATGPRALGLEAAVGLRDFSHRMVQAARRQATVRTAPSGWRGESGARPGDGSDRGALPESPALAGLFGLTHLLDLPPPTA